MSARRRFGEARSRAAAASILNQIKQPRSRTPAARAAGVGTERAACGRPVSRRNVCRSTASAGARASNSGAREAVGRVLRWPVFPPRFPRCGPTDRLAGPVLDAASADRSSGMHAASRRSAGEHPMGGDRRWQSPRWLWLRVGPRRHRRLGSSPWHGKRLNAASGCGRRAADGLRPPCPMATCSV